MTPMQKCVSIEVYENSHLVYNVSYFLTRSRSDSMSNWRFKKHGVDQNAKLEASETALRGMSEAGNTVRMRAFTGSPLVYCHVSWNSIDGGWLTSFGLGLWLWLCLCLWLWLWLWLWWTVKRQPFKNLSKWRPYCFLKTNNDYLSL